MTKALTTNNYAVGNCFQAVRERYSLFQRVEAGPGFYSRVTYFSAERTTVQASLPQGLETRVQKYERPQTRPQVIDTTLVNRIAPRERPRIYGQRETGYLTPTGTNRIAAYQKPSARLERYKQPERNIETKNRIKKPTQPNYEMLTSDLPNDFYLTPEDIKATLAKGYQGQVYEDNDKKLLQTLDQKNCRKCNTPIMLGEFCNRCIALN